MQVERTGYTGGSPGVISGNRVGVMMDDAAAGANNWRQFRQFARQVGNTGMSMLNEAQKQQWREDKSFVQDRDAKMKIAYAERSKAIFDRRGQEAAGAQDDMNALLDELKNEYGKELTTEQAKMFDEGWQRFRARSEYDAVTHRQEQMDWFERESSKEQLAAMTTTAKADAGRTGSIERILSGLYPQRIRTQIEAINRGAPKEAIDRLVSENVRSHHMEVLNTFAARSPDVALEYLETPSVKDAFDLEQYKKLRLDLTRDQIEAEQKAAISRGTSAAIGTIRNGGSLANVYLSLVKEVGRETADKVMSGVDKWRGYVKSEEEEAAKAEEARKKRLAEEEKAEEARRKEQAERGDMVLSESAGTTGRELAADEKLDETELRRRAYAEWPEKYAKIVIEAAEAERKAMQADRSTARVKRTMELDEELQKAGYDAKKMPSFDSLTTDEKTAWLKKGSDYRNASGHQAQPDIRRYNELQRLSDEELLDLWDSPELDAIITDLGGIGGKWFANLQSRVDRLSADREGATGKKGREKAETHKFLDTELNTIERDMDNVLQSTGRSVSKEEREQTLNAVLLYADRQYEQEITKAGVGKAEELPFDVRRRIHAEALLSYQSSGMPLTGWGAETITRAEAWAQGRDVSGWRLSAESLPIEIRSNYVGGTLNSPMLNGGRAYLAVDAPFAAAPGKAQKAYQTAGAGARIVRDISSGAWLVISPSGAEQINASGTAVKTMSAEEAASLRSVISPYADDPDYLYPFGRAGF